MAHYGPQIWFYATGAPAVNQPAAVFGPGDQNTFAAIYSDAGLTTPLPNPTTTDGSGYLEFYAADGVYWIFVGPVGTGDSVLVNLGAPGGFVQSVNGVFPDGAGDVTLTADDIGAQPLATIQALGDLYVGDGAGSTDNLPVGPEGYVLTADPDEPLGMFWAPPVTGGGGGAVDSVNGQTGAVDIFDPAIGAVPDTRQVLTQNGLTGGGDLGGDLTLEPDYGDQANTIAEGNDPRITGAIQSTIFAAKGDLLGASANDTPAIVPVGTDGQFLRAASGQTAGLEYHTLAAADVGLGNVNNTADADKPVSTAQATAITDTFSRGSAAIAAAGNTTVSPTTVYNRARHTDVTVAAFAGTATITLATTSTQSGDQRTFRLVVDPGAGTVEFRNSTSGGTLLGTLPAGGGTFWVSTYRTGSAWNSVIILRENTVTLVDGAQQRATLTAKGSIYVATSAGVVVERALGTDGQVLTVDTANADGVEWATPAGGGGAGFGFIIKPRTGQYSQCGALDVVRSSKAATLNAMYLRPFMITDAASLTAVAWEPSSSVTNAVVRLGVYASDADLLPDARIVDFGTFTSDTSGLRTVTGLSQALSANTLYWLAFVPQVALPNFRHSAGWNPWVSSTAFPAGSGAGWNSSYVETDVSGALPANTGTLAATDSPAVGIAF